MTETLPGLRESDFIIRDFRFASGETLPELRQHTITLGTPNAPAVLLIHNTTGTAKSWLEPGLAGELFGPGQPLDATRHFIVIPDVIGFGGSSKPSDGLRARITCECAKKGASQNDLIHANRFLYRLKW